MRGAFEGAISQIQPNKWVEFGNLANLFSKRQESVSVGGTQARARRDVGEKAKSARWGALGGRGLKFKRMAGGNIVDL